MAGGRDERMARDMEKTKQRQENGTETGERNRDEQAKKVGEKLHRTSADVGSAAGVPCIRQNCILPMRTGSCSKSRSFRYRLSAPAAI